MNLEKTIVKNLKIKRGEIIYATMYQTSHRFEVGIGKVKTILEDRTFYSTSLLIHAPAAEDWYIVGTTTHKMKLLLEGLIEAFNEMNSKEII